MHHLSLANNSDLVHEVMTTQVSHPSHTSVFPCSSRLFWIMYPHEVMTTQYPTHAAANVVHTFMALEVGVQPSELTAPTLVFGNPRDRVILSPHFPHMLEPIFSLYHPILFLNFTTRPSATRRLVNGSRAAAVARSATMSSNRYRMRAHM